MKTFTLTLSCPERPGIVHAVTSFLFQHDGDIVQHQQFDDAGHGMLFLRTAFHVADTFTEERLTEEFATVASQFDMTFAIRGDRQPRILAMVSRQGHCLNDLIFRWRSGTLGGDLVAVVSNHDDLRPMAEAAQLPFHVIPVTNDTKKQAEYELPRRGVGFRRSVRNGDPRRDERSAVPLIDDRGRHGA